MMDEIEMLFKKDRQNMYTTKDVAILCGVTTKAARQSLDRLTMEGAVEKFKFDGVVKYAAKLKIVPIRSNTLAKGAATMQAWDCGVVSEEDSQFHNRATQYGIKLDSGEKIKRELQLLKNEQGQRDKQENAFYEPNMNALYDIAERVSDDL